MASTGIQGLTGLQKGKTSNVPLSTPMYPGGPGNMNWPWAKFFDDLSDSTASGGTGSGAQGETGVQGLPGADGAAGPQGSTGIQGLDGQDGIQGQTGVQGETGLAGYTGLIGLANFIEADFYPDPITFTPEFLWNQNDEALFVGVTGINHWVQVGSGSPGQTGVQGETGIQGHTGMGVQGDTGIEGMTGLQGPGGGDRGATGVQGDTGLEGLANFIQNGFPAITNPPQFLWNFADESLYLGITGINGNWVQLGAGSQGVTGFGIQGTTGLQGQTGIQGNTGIRGNTGLQGQTGLGLANFIQNGFPAITNPPQFLWNFADEVLYLGITGLNGNWVELGAGSQGVTGFGIQGTTGLQGQTGIRGLTGIQGKTGLQGQTGLGLANFIEDGFPVITDPPQFLWNFADESLYLGITGINGNWVQLGAGSRGATGLYGPTGIQGRTGILGIQGVTGLALGSTGIAGPTGIKGAGSVKRCFSWSVRNPGAGGIPGPRLTEDYTCSRVDSFIISGTNCIFNIEDRTNVGLSGTNIMTDQTALTTAISTSSFTSGNLPADSWLWLNIKSVSSLPTNLAVTLSTTVSV